MKFLLILIVLASVYLFLAKRNSKSTEPAISSANTTEATVPGAPSAPAQSASPSSNLLKRPLDRTHAVLDQARKNQAEGF